MITEHCINPIYINNTFFNCGKCAYCRRAKKFQWTIRGKNELMENQKDSLFITLTYDNEHLPINPNTKPENERDAGGTLKPKDVTNFWKRLRKALPKGKKFKYIMCGEYGSGDDENYGYMRPHYHAILFGLSHMDIDEEDLKYLWGNGRVDINKEPFIEMSQIAYVIGYVDKKMTEQEDYQKYEKNGRIPPYQRVSKGIGEEYGQKHINEWIDNLSIPYNQSKAPLPRYYIEKIFKEEGRSIILESERTGIKLNEDEKNEEYIKKTKYYKTFKNPYGERTQKIIKKLYERKIENIKNYEIKYKVSLEIVQKLIHKAQKDYAEKINKMFEEWEYIQNKSDEEIQNEWKLKKELENQKKTQRPKTDERIHIDDLHLIMNCKDTAKTENKKIEEFNAEKRKTYELKKLKENYLKKILGIK